MKKVFALLLCLLLLTITLAACDSGKEPPHEHSFDSTWLYDEAQHWHAAACEHTDLESDSKNTIKTVPTYYFTVTKGG